MGGATGATEPNPTPVISVRLSAEFASSTGSYVVLQVQPVHTKAGLKTFSAMQITSRYGRHTHYRETRATCYLLDTCYLTVLKDLKPRTVLKILNLSVYHDDPRRDGLPGMDHKGRRLHAEKATSRDDGRRGGRFSVELAPSAAAACRGDKESC